MIPLIILAIEDEDDRAFAEHLYVTYRRLMLSEIQKIVENAWDAEDVMHSVVVKLIDKLDLLRTLSRANLVNYIITASRNTAISLLREKKKLPAYSFDDLVDSMEEDSMTTEDRVMLELDQEIAHQAWCLLPYEVQSLLSAKYVLEQTDIEISKMLGIQKNSVRMALTRARRTFREQLFAMSN